MSEFASTRLYTLAEVQQAERAAHERGYAEGVRDTGSGRLRPGSPDVPSSSGDWNIQGQARESTAPDGSWPSTRPDGGWQGNG